MDSYDIVPEGNPVERLLKALVETEWDTRAALTYRFELSGAEDARTEAFAHALTAAAFEGVEEMLDVLTELPADRERDFVNVVAGRYVGDRPHDGETVDAAVRFLRKRIDVRLAEGR